MENKDIIVKIGSNTLVDNQGQVRDVVIEDVLVSLSEAVKRGQRGLVVTSGATKLGRQLLNDSSASIDIAAAVGQVEIFHHYQLKAKELGLILAELLMARPHLTRRRQFLNFQETVEKFFKQGIIPVVNENDALVAGTDWSFGDNDSLGASLAIALKVKRFIILTHINGLFSGDPVKNRKAFLIKEVTDVNTELMKYCSHEASQGGRGGMVSKLKAMRICTAFGIKGQIINGLVKGNLKKVIGGQNVGTVFWPRNSISEISNRERWLLAAKNSTGSLEIDEGAIQALHNGKSLLAVGVKKVYGQFQAKEIIEVINKEKEGVAFGIVDYSEKEIRIMLKKKDLYDKQIMHVNNLIIFG